MAALTRPEGHKRVEGRLGIDDPRTKSCLAALDPASADLGDLARFSNKLHRDADAWLRRRGGFAERGRISRRDADRVLKWELAKLDGGAG